MVTKKENGITLIALIITIIILLILAGITIASLTGENGILNKANSAKEETTKQGAKEKVQVEVMGSYDNNGKINLEELNENLRKNIAGLTYQGKPISNDNKIEALPAIVIVDGYNVKIHENGNVTIEEDIILNEASIKVISGEQQENEWYTSDVKIRVQASGYQINGENVNIPNGFQEFVINEDGIYEITAYYNTQEETLTIKRDTSKPDDFTPIDGIGNGTGKQLEINSKANDLSGISEYRYYLNGNYVASTRKRKIYFNWIRTFCGI